MSSILIFSSQIPFNRNTTIKSFWSSHRSSPVEPKLSKRLFLLVIVACLSFTTLLFFLPDRTPEKLLILRSHTLWTGQEQLFQPVRIQKRFLFFSRVPKTGSVTMIKYLKILAAQNNFTYYGSGISDRRRLTRKEQAGLVRYLSSLKKPLSYQRHLYFTNFIRQGYDGMPIFVSVVREPAEKFNSRFFYHRSANYTSMYRKLVARGIVNQSLFVWRNMTLNECLNLSLPECTYQDGEIYDLSIPYFCGHELDCARHNNERALARAIHNVEKFYPVVGVLEMFNESLAVMEHKLPFFFRNVTKLKYKKSNKTPRKKPLGQLAADRLRNSLNTEVQFYQYLVHRLRTQYSELLQEQTNQTTEIL